VSLRRHAGVHPSLHSRDVVAALGKEFFEHPPSGGEAPE
jgi:hypothetical protein